MYILLYDRIDSEKILKRQKVRLALQGQMQGDGADYQSRKIWRHQEKTKQYRIKQNKIVKNVDILLACRLISLNKLTGVRIGKVLRRIIGKIVMKPPRRDVLNTTDNCDFVQGRTTELKQLSKPFTKCLTRKMQQQSSMSIHRTLSIDKL